MNRLLTPIAVATVLVLAGCGSSSPAPRSAPAVRTSAASRTASPRSSKPSAVPRESAVPVESNPPGDIPDSTRYLSYHSATGGFTLKVPEGWSRTTSRSSVSFSDKLNSVTVQWFKASSAPTTGSARSKDVPQLRRTVRAFSLKEILACAPSCTIPYTTNPIDVRLPKTRAVVIRYFANSAPNAVTGRQYRDEVLRFEFFKHGNEAALVLSGPVGSDNVDPWRLVSESFAWS